jgi:hypothetical protein
MAAVHGSAAWTGLDFCRVKAGAFVVQDCRQPPVYLGGISLSSIIDTDAGKAPDRKSKARSSAC